MVKAVLELFSKTSSSEFFNRNDIEYFNFEEDFVEKNIRCIPMIVRFKMDQAGIKLKLTEWNKFSVVERIELAKKDCSNENEIKLYNHYLVNLIINYTGKAATSLQIDDSPAWTNTSIVPEILLEKLRGYGWQLSTKQWKDLSKLQRFALLKLCKDGHENKNFPKAMKEFKLVN